MKAIRVLAIISSWAALVSALASQASGQGTDHFAVTIPKKTTSPFIPIGAVKAVVGLTNAVTAGAPVTFTITDQMGTSQQVVCSPACTPSSLTFNDNESGSRGPDTVTIFPTSGPQGDPVRYEMDFLLSSNLASGNSCTNTQQVDPNSYTVRIGSASANSIVGVCLESFDGRIRTTRPPINSCTPANFASQSIPVPTTPGDEVATIDSLPQPAFACYNSRPPLDVVMVLDKSGSMSTKTTPGSCPTPPCTRMDALHSAVTTFLDDWAALSPPNDNVAVVAFDTTATARKVLQDVVANKATIETDVNNNVTPGGSTSIGAGLVAANPLVGASAGRRKVVLLMSDGQQNTNPFVQVDTRLYCSGNPSHGPCAPPVGPGCTAGVGACALTNSPQIYTVTLGPSSTLDPAINAQISAATLGYYLNTETNASLLRPFFLQLLQNFVRFNSYETVRLISANTSLTTPYASTLPISTTSHDAVLGLMWAKNLGPLRLIVTPPGGGPAIVREDSSGFISLVQPLPLPDPFDPRDDWKIAVEIPNGPGLNPPEGVPFDLHIMTDDAGIKSDLSVVPGDYKPGDKIKLRAKLAQFGRPILGLGSHPGDRIEAELVKPGKSVGDILSDSTASADPSGPDPQSRAGAKLTNTLNQDPSVLVHQSDTVQLFDDGNPAHGDDVAGDGIYSALYPATLPGHYNFLFAVESTAPDAVRFSRQQIRTAYVRPFADRGNTTFQTSIQPCAPTALTPQGCKTLTILMAPRTKAHDRMGPGWGSYFWFVTPGQAPVKAVDSPRLDGTYTAVIDFNGAIPPKVSVHFINVIALIDDSATVGQLPQQLDANNLLAEITASGASRVAAFLDFGAAVPHPGFANVANTGFSLNAGLEYVWTSNVSTEGIFGYHHFSVVGPVIVNVGGNCGPQFGIPCPVTPGPRIGLNVYQFSANAKVYLRPPPKKLRPFVNGGPGSYKFSPGSWSVGGNVGAGTLYEVTPRFGVQGSYNFHAVNTSGGATTFSTLQGGIRVVF